MIDNINKLLYKKKEKGYIREIALYIFVIILIIIFINAFLVESYEIPSESMYPNLSMGDKILAIKFKYRIRLPIIDFSYPGLSKAQRGDLVIFEHPEYKSPGVIWEIINLFTLKILKLDSSELNLRMHVKRCIAIPGDTIIIDSDQNEVDVYLNGEKLKKKPVKEYKSDDYIRYLEINKGKSYIVQYFKNRTRLNKSSSTFYIPKKGDRIIIKKQKTELGNYENVYEINGFKLDKKLFCESKFYSLLEEEMGSKYYTFINLIDPNNNDTNYFKYTIKHNYYFLLGDNRDESSDSREWGLINEELIVAKPWIRYYPFNSFKCF